MPQQQLSTFKNATEGNIAMPLKEYSAYRYELNIFSLFFLEIQLVNFSEIAETVLLFTH